MRKLILALLLVVIAFPAFSAEKERESTYDRVMRTGTIRCGYVIYDPSLTKNLQTGAIEGIIYDIMETIGARLNLKIEWTEEVGFASLIEGFKTNRYDMVCGSIWTTSERGKFIDYALPLWYSGVGVWVRSDDNRFDNDLSLLNDPNVTVSAIDGTSPSVISPQDYPKAKILSAPTLTDYSFNLTNVANGKADVTFVETYQGNQFLAHNPGKVKNIAKNNPIRLFSNSVVMNKGEFEFYQMINTSLREHLYNGVIDKIIDKYEKYPSSFYRVAKPYEVSK